MENRIKRPKMEVKRVILVQFQIVLRDIMRGATIEILDDMILVRNEPDMDEMFYEIELNPQMRELLKPLVPFMVKDENGRYKMRDD